MESDGPRPIGQITVLGVEGWEIELPGLGPMTVHVRSRAVSCRKEVRGGNHADTGVAPLSRGAWLDVHGWLCLSRM